jgi:site-specific DNA-cytosine methylase
MKVLVACEFSGIVRDAFRRQGHDAWSCDLLPSEKPGPHLQAPNQFYLKELFYTQHWDMLIAFPPCTHLAVSGARWFKNKRREQGDAAAFFMDIAEARIQRVCVENPIGIMSTEYRKPDQIIQPWQFGHGETKATCLWLKNLPLLNPTKIVEGRVPRVHYAAPSPDRWKERSRIMPGIADAMAEQWGNA